MSEGLSVALAILGGTGLTTLLVKEIWNMIKTHSKRYKEHIQRAKLEEIKSSIGDIIDSKLTPIMIVQEENRENLKKIQQDLIDTKEGLQVSLKHDIRSRCKECIIQGYRTFDDVEEVSSMHDRYEKLGENGVTNALYDEFQRLRTVPNDYKKETTSKKRTTKQILTEDK